jgi:hypothetical protein
MAPTGLGEVMAATRFFASESSVPLNGEKWAIVGAETQVTNFVAFVQFLVTHEFKS